MTLTKTIIPLAIVLMFAISMAFTGIPDAEAKAVDDKLVDKAKKVKDIKEEIKSARYDDKIKLEKEKEDYIKYLNREGIPTIEQWNEDKTYWIEQRLDVLEKERSKSVSLTSVIYEENDSQIYNISSCCSPNHLKYKAGYGVPAWGFMWNTYASSWTYLGVGENGYSKIIFDDRFNDGIEPFHVNKSTSSGKTINFEMDYVSHDAGYDEIDSEFNTYNHYYATTYSAYIDDYDALNDVETDSEFKFNADVNSVT